MGKGSNGDNWPSTTGNPSGGGRCNAGSSDSWDDDDNDVNPAYVKGFSGGRSMASVFSEAFKASTSRLPSVPPWAATIAFFMNIRPRSSNESRAQSNEMYSEMGLKHGAILYRVGLGGFVIASIVGWVIFYG